MQIRLAEMRDVDAPRGNEPQDHTLTELSCGLTVHHSNAAFDKYYEHVNKRASGRSGG
jgi:hypothetical protein